ncbi:MAG TPA: energy transducer TonB [Candidatus Polarisedimenticolia bacterium]|nr:energy transducer TonB [Candidatus Polarisedimenticolia bacterium]
MRGIIEDAEPSRPFTWYEPEQDYLASDDFKTFPAIREEKDGQRSLTLRVIRKSEKGIGIQSLEFRVDGASATIPLKRHDVDIDHQGCRVAERMDLEDQEALIRRIAAGKQVEVVVTGILSTDTYALQDRDLEDFRRILALYDRPDAFGGSVREDATVTNPVLIKSSKVQPVFPAKARRRAARGRVVLQAVIRKDGTVGDVKVLRSTACDCGFEAAAASAVMQWRYKPGTKDGQPIDVYLTVIVDFAYLR